MFSGPPVVPPAHLRVQILRAADHGCQPAPGLPCALFTEEGTVWRKTRAFGAARMLMHACAENEMVLPDRIELSTSPLPMECSTTELRQHALDKNRPPRGAYQAGRYLPQASPLCKLAGPVKTRKSGRYRGLNGCFGSKPPASCRFGFRYPRPTGQLAELSDSIHFEVRTIGSHGPLELPYSSDMFFGRVIAAPS